MKRSVVVLFLALVAGALLSVGSTASGAGVTHRVTVGSADVVLFPPGTDANFSLVAIEQNGTARGQWHDQFADGSFVHVDVNCLEVVGNDAWLSGPIKKTSPDLAFLVGEIAVTRVRDNGTSANDPADQVSLSTAFAGDCHGKPNLTLYDLNNGEAKVQ
jgi:hypothetical protein